MGDITLGEIRLFPYATVIPAGWMACEGQVLQVKTNAALASLLGNRFGGDGQTTFALPDLRGRAPVPQWLTVPPDTNRIGTPSGLQLGNKGGTETVILTIGQTPSHTHAFAAEPTNATAAAILNSVPSTSTKQSTTPATAPAAPNIYAPPGTLVPVNPGFIGATGGNGGHENRQPYLALRFCICTQGLYPMRN